MCAVVDQANASPGVDGSRTVRTPIAASRSLMIATSAMSGTLDSAYSPSASKRRRHQLEHRVLRARHHDAPLQRPRPVHHDLLVGVVGGRGGIGGRRGHGPPVWPRLLSSRCSGHPADSFARGPSTRPSKLGRPRNSIVAEVAAGDDRWVQAEGPFSEYERTLRVERDQIVDTTTYRLTVPWFGVAVPLADAHRAAPPTRPATASSPCGLRPTG